jgi:hypothetical protein
MIATQSCALNRVVSHSLCSLPYATLRFVVTTVRVVQHPVEFKCWFISKHYLWVFRQRDASFSFLFVKKTIPSFGPLP